MFRRLFSIDCRSLVLFRVNLALIFLFDLGRRSSDLAAHYTDWGVLPREAARQLGLFSSLHSLSGSAPLQAALFLLSAGCALALLFGRKSRLSALCCWLLLLSLHDRNPMILYGGDIVLRLLFFWSLFLPLDTFRPKQVASAATLALLLQVACIYWSGLYFKWEGGWLEGSALYYALHIDQFATPLGIRLRDFEGLLPPLSYLVYFLEGALPLAALLPLGRGRIRLIAALSMMGLHLSFGLFLELGLFPWISIACWIPFLPSLFWDQLSSCLPLPQTRKEEAFSASIGSSCMASFCFLTVLLANFWALHPKSSSLPLWVKGWSRLAEALHLHQKWSMFARPLREDGWFIAEATLLNGERIDLLRGGSKTAWSPPPLISACYQNDRWRKYCLNLFWPQHAEHRPLYLRYLAREWNRRHKGLKRAASIELYYLLNETGPPPLGKKGPRPLLLWREDSLAS